jgi:hypothetical protein
MAAQLNFVPSWVSSMRFAVVRKESKPIAPGSIYSTIDEEVVAVFADVLDAEIYSHGRNRGETLAAPMHGRARVVFTVEENRP